MGNPLTNFILSTLRQIDRDYQPGALASMKKTEPVEWGKLVAIEQEINLAAKNGDPRALKKALDSYQKLVITLVKKFNEKVVSRQASGRSPPPRTGPIGW